VAAAGAAGGSRGSRGILLVGRREVERAEVAAMVEGVAYHRAHVLGRILIPVVGPPAPSLFFWAEERAMAGNYFFSLPPLQELFPVSRRVKVLPEVVLLPQLVKAD